MSYTRFENVNCCRTLISLQLETKHGGTHWIVSCPSESQLHVRACPAADATLIAQLESGTDVTETARDGRWIKHESGWSWSEHLTQVCSSLRIDKHIYV